MLFARVLIAAACGPRRRGQTCHDGPGALPALFGGGVWEGRGQEQRGPLYIYNPQDQYMLLSSLLFSYILFSSLLFSSLLFSSLLFSFLLFSSLLFFQPWAHEAMRLRQTFVCSCGTNIAQTCPIGPVSRGVFSLLSNGRCFSFLILLAIRRHMIFDTLSIWAARGIAASTFGLP